MGVRCTIATLSKNRITKLDSWSKIEETIRYLSSRTLDHHKNVIQQQITNMEPQQVGKKLYSADVLVRAFEYYATSRCMYHKLRVDFKLPSIKTLSRITSKVNKLSDSQFITHILSNIEERQKNLYFSYI